jgi:hypothetical protein
MGRILLGLIGATAIAAAGAGIAIAGSSVMQNMHAMTTTRLTIAPQHGSGQHGTATRAQKGTSVVVTLTMSGIPHGVAEPTHIHPGTCAHLTPSPKWVLTNATDGTTTTTLPHLQLATIVGGTYAINVHDAHNLAHYVACGNIK